MMVCQFRFVGPSSKSHIISVVFSQKTDYFHLENIQRTYDYVVLAPVSMSSQNTQGMHNLATVNTTTHHVQLLGPSVRRLLDSYGLDRHSIKASGHKGQLLKGDVLKYINKHAKAEIKFTHILQGE